MGDKLPLEHLKEEKFKSLKGCSALIVQIFFINPRPAYCKMEKGREGERDTGITSGKGVTRHLARGYLRTYNLDRWRGARERSPPPINPYLFWTV